MHGAHGAAEVRVDDSVDALNIQCWKRLIALVYACVENGDVDITWDAALQGGVVVLSDIERKDVDDLTAGAVVALGVVRRQGRL